MQTININGKEYRTDHKFTKHEKRALMHKRKGLRRIIERFPDFIDNAGRNSAGEIQKIYYLNDNNEKEGLCLEWRRNRQIFIIQNYKNGKRHGLQQDFHSNGQLFGEATYKDGKQEGLVTIRLSCGSLFYDAVYKDGEEVPFTGIKRYHYTNGQLMKEVPFKDGKWDGLYKSFYENGHPDWEVNYKDDKKDGTAKMYIDGVLVGEWTYKNGELITNQ